MKTRNIRREDATNNVVDTVLLAAMRGQAEKRPRLGIPQPPGADVRELTGRLVPKVKEAAWYIEGPTADDAPAPSDPDTAAEPGRRTRGRSKSTARKRDEEPEVDTAPADEDERYPLIPAGDKYQARLVRVVLKQQWARWVWICWFVVVEGDHAGVELPMYLSRPQKDRESRVSRSWAISAAYTVATGRRPPKNLARLRPDTYLGNKQFLVRVVSVERDQYGAEVPPGARYSKIKNLIKPSIGGKGPA